jgi:protein-disulfide isomerase
MNPLRRTALAAVILMNAAGCHSEAKHTTGGGDSKPAVAGPVQAPANGDWTQVVVPTKQGGFLMGNPNAKVHLVEFGSLTCPHCKAFNDEGVPALLANYVKPGKVSYEFRNYVRDPYDITAALIVRCDGAKRFFSLTAEMYKEQDSWLDKLDSVPHAQDRMESMSDTQEFLTAAQWAGFPQWAAARGIPIPKSTQCLTDKAEIDRLVQMNSDATDEYDIPGTPTFLINGKVAEEATTWDTLKPALDKALGQRG